MVSALDYGVVSFKPWPRDIVLCSWARHLTCWIPANLMLLVTLQWTSVPSRGSGNTTSHFMLLKL